MISIIGWLGAICILVAYGLLTFRKVDNRSLKYHALNLVGGSSIAVDSYFAAAYPATALNIVFATLGAYGVFRSQTHFALRDTH